MNGQDFLEKMQNFNTAYDSIAKETDILFEKVSADIQINLPDYVLHNDGVIFNQRSTKLCVAYGTTAGINEELNTVGIKGDKNPDILFKYIKNNLDSNIDKQGTLIENGSIGARKLGRIEAYVFCKTIYDLQKALVLVGPVSSGTNKINWAKLKKNNFVAIPGSGGGHFVNIVGYNTKIENAIYGVNGEEYKDYFIVENTWGDKWGNRGRYFIPFEFALEILFNVKISNIINKELNKKHASKILANIKNEFEEKKVTPVTKYDFFNGEDLIMTDKENKDLFIIMQKSLKETGYNPVLETIIGSNEDRTYARILNVITHSIEFGRKEKQQ